MGFLCQLASNHVVRKLQESYKNFVTAGVNESIVEYNALNSWKLNIFKIIEGRKFILLQ